MSEFRRRLMMQQGDSFPYKFVEYIDSSVGAYINPNITIGENSVINVDIVAFTLPNNIHNDFFGYSGPYWNFVARSDFRQDYTTIYRTTGAAGGLDYNFELNTRYCVSVGTTASVNGNNIGIIPGNMPLPENPCYVMATYQAGGVGYAAGSNRLYLFQIYESGTLVCDLKPCVRIVDGEVGVYDIVRDMFFGNAGTGTLTAAL